jgi:putative transposase
MTRAHIKILKKIFICAGVRQTAALCYQGTMNGERFEDWFENNLLKSLKKGKTIIMDRARFHRKNKLEILEAISKCQILKSLPMKSAYFAILHSKIAKYARDNFKITNFEIISLCETAGVRLLFLSPYSPDFNPIEKTQVFMKRELRSTAPMYDLLETAIYKHLN